MKHRILALALMLILALVPVQAAAAQLQALPEPAIAPTALAERLQPQKTTYTITMTHSGSGKAELYNAAAGAGESVYFLADPEPGYQVSFEKCGYRTATGQEDPNIRLYYIGANVYELVMPAGDVLLELEFVKITTSSHDVRLTVSEGGMASVDRKTAKKGESLFVEVITGPGYSSPSVRARSGGREEAGYYLGTVEGARLYEVFMPNGDLEILVNFERNGPYAITTRVEKSGGSLELSHQSAYELETVTVTARPDRGYQLSSIRSSRAQLTRIRENVWTFQMPRHKEELCAVFEAIVYPVSVSMELSKGGTACLDTAGAVIGQTVTLTCSPDAGYRVARITGAKVTDHGGNTYSFVMDAAPVELKVLFLRENNPFLDVNETQFYHDPVLWAVENGITNGVDATHFGPLKECNRAQVVTFLWRAAGSPSPTATENPFTDVPANTWYTDAVLWAVENGITNGLTATTFGPETVCNRAQVVTFLHRVNGSPVPEAAANPFTDVKAGSWYETPVLWALENGITNGTDTTHFNPNGQCQRAQVVTFLYRADQLSQPAPDPLPGEG